MSAEAEYRHTQKEPGNPRLANSHAAQHVDLVVMASEWAGRLGGVATSALVDVDNAQAGKAVSGIMGSRAAGDHWVWVGMPDELGQTANARDADTILPGDGVYDGWR